MRTLRVQSRFSNSMMKDLPQLSFINFASLSSYFIDESLDDIVYCCDGMLMAGLISLLTGTSVSRVSFDNTSIAPLVFQFSAEKGYPVFLVGATTEQVDAFATKLKSTYSDINLAGYVNGFFNLNEIDLVVESIRRSGAKIVILGLGAGKQEAVLSIISKQINDIAIFTCGGFIRQEATSKKEYYPPVIDKVNMRFLYRMYKEPHTIKRYLIDYPINLIKIICMKAKGKIQIEVY